MSFSDAIPVNNMTHSKASSFASAKRRNIEEASGAPRQRVNISRETSQRAAARQKLGNALLTKLSYNPSGEYGKERPVGVYLSATA